MNWLSRHDGWGIRAFFAITFVAFATILSLTYSQSIDSVEAVLDEQLTIYLTDVEEALQTFYPILDQETKLLARNGALRQLYLSEGPPDKTPVKKFLDWFTSSAQARYLAIAYLTPDGRLLYDSAASSSSELPGTASTTSAYTELARGMAVDQRDLSVGFGVVYGTEVALLSRSLSMGRIKGIVVAVLPLQELLPILPARYTTLTLSESNTGRTLYETTGDEYKAVAYGNFSWAAIWAGSNRTLSAETRLERPAWTLSAEMAVLPYLAKPRRAGRITLIASLTFIVIVGIIIQRLQQRVERRSAALAQANNDIAAQNARLEDAQKIIQEHNEMLQAELETASQMQMRLMPTNNPAVPGFNVAGRCRPATHVGGDFFQYYPRGQGRLSIAMADVTGHGMQAAIPNVLFSGMLENQMESEVDPETLMDNLNRSLTRSLESRTFVCFSLGELDPNLRRIHLVNGGCPYPYHYIAETAEVCEVETGALPLGLRAGSQYSGVDCELAIRDRIVFCSDGIIEASNANGQLFGFERTRLTIERLAQQGLTAASMVDAILADIDEFCEGTEQEDDQTVLVVEAT